MRAFCLGAALVCLVAGPAPVAATTIFVFSHEFDEGVFGPDKTTAGSGTATGIAVGAGGNVLIADSLDDQIFESDPNGVLLRALQTDPFCELAGPPTCTPGVPAHQAQFMTDLAFHPTTGNIWALDDQPSGDPTVLNELDGNGVFLQDFDITNIVPTPGGLTFDPRNLDPLVTDVGNPDSVVRLSASQPNDPFGATFYALGPNGPTAPHAITPLDAAGTFLVLDSITRQVFEYLIPAGAGAATLLGTSTLLGGPDLSGAETLGAAFDPVSQRLYLTDSSLADRVLVYTVIPEPATSWLLGLGLMGLAAARTRGRRTRT